MGSTNFIVVPKMKVVIETSRDVNEIEDYIAKTLDELLFDEIESSDEYIEEVKIKEINIRNLTTLFRGYKLATNLEMMDFNKLFLYWLTKRNIEYKIESEYVIKLDEYRTQGYTIIRWGDD